MPKTFADYSHDERDRMVGMWCDYPSTRPRPGIIYHIEEGGDPAVLRFDVRNEVVVYFAEYVTPRHDLPRAWDADGTPAGAEWSRERDIEGTK